jgi:diamine N-acetyltransferase
MSETFITIRRAEAADAEMLSALATTTFYEAYFEQDEPRDLGAYCVAAFNLEQMRNELENRAATFFIAELRKKAVGYAKLREDSKAPGVADDRRAIELQRIYILEKAKGRGVGLELMKTCLAEAARKGYETVWLGVWSENLPAQKFYEKLGFEKVGELPFKYGDGWATNFVLAKKI